MRRTFDTVNSVLVVGMVAAALWAWPRLPDRTPTHFGPDGLADAWGETTAESWFMIPGVAVLLVAGIGWFRWMMPRKPGWVNLSEKTRLENLPEATRGPVLEMVSGFLAMVQTELLVIFALIQLSTYRTVFGHGDQWMMILVLLVALLSPPVFVVVFFLFHPAAVSKGKALAEAMKPEQARG